MMKNVSSKTDRNNDISVMPIYPTYMYMNIQTYITYSFKYAQILYIYI